MRDPLIGPVAAVASGILVCRFVPFGQVELLAAIAGFLLLGILAFRLNSRALAAVCCLCGLVCAGALTALVHAPGARPELDVEGRELVVLSGCVVEPPAISDDRERFLLELEPHARAQVTLWTRNGDSLPRLRYGQQIEIEARVRKPRNFGNPGAFDYDRYLARQDVYWTASSRADTLRTLPGTCGSSFQKAVMDLRAAILQRIERLYAGNAYQSGMTQALLMGQNFQLQKVWTEEYRDTGTFHVLVISGTHVAILAAFFLFLLRICFVPESFALTVTLVITWLYALVAGWGAPLVRSAAGLTLAVICGYFYRERRPINLLAAVALAFLLFDPEQLFDSSFQLTFLAVACLGLFAAPLIRATSGPLARGLSDLDDTHRDLHLEPRVAQFRIEMRLLAGTLRMWLRLPAPVARLAIVVPARILFFIYEVAAVSAAVQIGLALPMALYFHRIGLSGLSANIFVVPVMGAAVPIGFIAVATGWGWVAHLCALLMSVSRAVVGWHASLEPGWRVATPPLWLILAAWGALVAAAWLPGKWWRIGAGAAALILLALVVWHPFPPEIRRGELEMSAIDVGQGDAILLVFPDGKRMLVDGGGIPVFGQRQRARLEVGEDVVAPYLWERGIENVDVMVLSHAHEDHIGGLPALVDAFHPRELWTGATPESASWRLLRSRAAANRVRVSALSAPAHFGFGGAEIEVLAPFSDYLPGQAPKNNDSLVLRVRYGRHAFLLSGDVEKPIERRMLAEGEASRTDVLKVPHHGSRTSSTEEFLEAVNPAFAVISVGADNSYGHPTEEVVDRLQQHHAALFRTDRNGLVTIRTDGKRLAVETYR